ncbi:MAG: cold-shock protein, partial [Actinomycetota bacterium]
MDRGTTDLPRPRRSPGRCRPHRVRSVSRVHAAPVLVAPLFWQFPPRPRSGRPTDTASRSGPHRPRKEGTPVATGTVKWFSPEKGFGFITQSEGP